MRRAPRSARATGTSHSIPAVKSGPFCGFVSAASSSTSGVLPKRRQAVGRRRPRRRSRRDRCPRDRRSASWRSNAGDGDVDVEPASAASPNCPSTTSWASTRCLHRDARRDAELQPQEEPEPEHEDDDRQEQVEDEPRDDRDQRDREEADLPVRSTLPDGGRSGRELQRRVVGGWLIATGLSAPIGRAAAARRARGSPGRCTLTGRWAVPDGVEVRGEPERLRRRAPEELAVAVVRLERARAGRLGAAGRSSGSRTGAGRRTRDDAGGSVSELAVGTTPKYIVEPWPACLGVARGRGTSG